MSIFVNIVEGITHRRAPKNVAPTTTTAPASAKAAGTKVTFLPKTRKAWTLTAVVLVIALQPVLLLIGMHTGRIGYTLVEGNSMCNVFPWGCLVVVLPLHPHDGEYVVAWTWGGMDGVEDKADKKSGFVIKRLTNGHLVSTDCQEKYTKDFSVRGVVVAWLPIQKVLLFLDKGMQNPYPGFKYPNATDIAILDAREQLRVKLLETRLYARVGGNYNVVKYYGHMQEKPSGNGQRGFHIDVPPGEVHFFKFICSAGANGVSPMVLRPKSGRRPIPFEDGFLIRSHGDLRVECLMPFTLGDVFVLSTRKGNPK